jgi:N-acetylmuramoyl-L-alanine amidase
MSKIICLDPGHGGSDPGACGNGLQEAALTGALCEHIKAKLAAYDVQVEICTRTDSLTARANYANNLKADYFLSVHINAAGNPTATGFESFCCEGAAEDSEAMRSAIHDSIAAYLAEQGITQRGKKNHSWTVLFATNMPASLIELLFINNPSDAAKLADPTFMYGLINSITYGLAVALKLEKKPEPAVIAVVDTVKEAINKLVAAGVIVSPEYWLVNAKPGESCNGAYVAWLIETFASKI